MTKILLVGESWVSISTHYKGFNHFVSGVYETGLEWFNRAMKKHNIELTHMPAHLAANEFRGRTDISEWTAVVPVPVACTMASPCRVEIKCGAPAGSVQKLPAGSAVSFSAS